MNLTRAVRNGRPILCILLFLALALILLWPAVTHPTRWLWKPDAPHSDLAVSHWPNARFTRRVLWQEGRFPLWRSTIMSGTPFAANPITGLYYPLNWLLLFLPWLPLGVSFNLSALIHLTLAGSAMYTLMRQGFSVGVSGAVAAAVIYEASPKLLAHLGTGHIGWTQAWAWLPLVVLCTAKIYQSTGLQVRRWATGAGVALAVQFCADVRMTAYTLIAATTLAMAWTMTRLNRAKRDGEEQFLQLVSRAIRVLKPSLLSVAIFLGLSACLWLPGFALLPVTTRASLTLQDGAIWSLPWRYLGGLFLADHGGFHEWMTFVGVATLVLAWAGTRALWRHRRRRWLAGWLIGLAVFAAWFSLGENGGLFPVLWRFVPGLGLLRVPPRAWVLVVFATSVLAGLGTGRARHAGRRMGLAALAIGALPPMLVIGYWLMVDRPPMNLVAFGIVTPLAMLLCSGQRTLGPIPPSTALGGPSRDEAVRGAATRLGSDRPDWLGIAIVLLVTLDLLIVDFTLIETRTPEEVFAPGNAAAQWLADQPGRFRVYSPSYSLPQHLAERYTLELADGVDPLQLQPYADYLVQAAGLQDQTGYSVTLPPFPEGSEVRTALAEVSPNTDMLGHLGVRYVAAAFPMPHSRLDLVRRFDDVYLYRNKDARALPGKASAPRIVLANGQVLFQYHPWAVYAGWVISGLTLITLGMSCWWNPNRRQRARS